jgi:hypothetical protein
MLFLAMVIAPAMAASKDKPVDFSGTWKLNMSKSKGPPDWRPETVLVVVQTPYQIHFAYFLNADTTQPFENHDFVPNGKEVKAYVTANEYAYVSTRWTNKNMLQVRLRHLVHAEIADTEWTETDYWSLSDDGKTLTNKLSDGKVLVYDKQQKDKAY